MIIGQAGSGGIQEAEGVNGIRRVTFLGHFRTAQHTGNCP
jgi:hypothetical protein